MVYYYISCCICRRGCSFLPSFCDAWLSGEYFCCCLAAGFFLLFFSVGVNEQFRHRGRDLSRERGSSSRFGGGLANTGKGEPFSQQFGLFAILTDFWNWWHLRRCLSQINTWQTMDYKVVLFTDKPYQHLHLITSLYVCIHHRYIFQIEFKSLSKQQTCV